MMWGAKVKLRNDMPDDMLKYAIDSARQVLEECENFDNDGLLCAEKLKTKFEERWAPHWHVIMGRNFGSYVTHETKKFVFFYLDDKEIMIFKNSL